MIALLTALEAEAEGFISKTKIISIVHWNEYEIVIGDFYGQECLIASTGIGKVQAAVVTTYLIDNYSPTAVFYTGIAGALKSDLNIGDVVIAGDCVQWDVDITSFGFKPGELPLTNTGKENKRINDTVRFYKTDSELLIRASTWHPGGFKVRTGRIITGDSFLNTSKRNEIVNLLTELDGDAVEMEGASAAAAARMQNVPFFLARVISDTVDGRKPGRFKQFLKESSNKMSNLAEFILNFDSA